VLVDLEAVSGREVRALIHDDRVIEFENAFRDRVAYLPFAWSRDLLRPRDRFFEGLDESSYERAHVRVQFLSLTGADTVGDLDLLAVDAERDEAGTRPGFLVIASAYMTERRRVVEVRDRMEGGEVGPLGSSGFAVIDTLFITVLEQLDAADHLVDVTILVLVLYLQEHTDASVFASSSLG